MPTSGIPIQMERLQQSVLMRVVMVSKLAKKGELEGYI